MIAAAHVWQAQQRDMAIRATVVLLLILGLTGCPQMTYFVGITLKNNCAHSVHVTTTHASDMAGYYSSTIIAPLQSERVAGYTSVSNDIRMALREGYTLTIDGDGGSETFGRTEIIEMLDGVKRQRDGKYFSIHQISYDPPCKRPAH